MSTQLITNYFRVHALNQFRESINETANSVYYVFAARHTPYVSGDDVIEDLTNDVNGAFYNPHQEMVFGKRVGASDVMPLTKRYNWTQNTVYAAYRDNIDLSEKAYYVCVNASSSYHIFKCLDNNGNTPSTITPNVSQTSPNDAFYSTSDGYVWKYMYSFDSTTFNKFATADYMPVTSNTLVTGNAVSGAIDVITVDYKGSDYNTYLSNTFNSTDLRVGGSAVKYSIDTSASSTAGFYVGSFLYIKSGTGSGQGRRIVGYTVVGATKTVEIASAFSVNPDITSVYEITPSVVITGDGSNAVARALVNTSSSNSIYQVEVIERGYGYTYASAAVAGNTSGVQNSAVLSITLGPKGGHGANPEYELGARYLCFSVDFANNENGTIPIANKYRSVGIIKDPLFSNVTLTLGSVTGSFDVGEIVTQACTSAVGYVTDFTAGELTLTNVAGVFNLANVVTGAGSSAVGNVTALEINGDVKSFDTFDQRYRYTFTPVSGTFTQNETVYQTDPQITNAVFHSNTSGNVYLTHVKGVLNTSNTIIGTNSGAVGTLLYAYKPDLVVGSGEVIYMENENPITRSQTQKETIKIILKF